MQTLKIQIFLLVKVFILTLAMLNKIKMARPLLIFSQSGYLIQVVDTNSHTSWQTVQIQMGYLGLHCLQRQGISGFKRTRVNNQNIEFVKSLCPDQFVYNGLNPCLVYSSPNDIRYFFGINTNKCQNHKEVLIYNQYQQTKFCSSKIPELKIPNCFSLPLSMLGTKLTFYYTYSI